jgi:hypothetical protein
MLLPSATKNNPSLLIAEFGLTAIVILASFAWPQMGTGLFARIERAFGRLARRRRLAAACVGLSVLVVRLAILPLVPIPVPFVTDDFSFLLAADTFLHGRLTNPTPAMWVHFETIHITMLPTYMSMYFPGEALILAAGKLLFGNPWFGGLLASAVMCGALCWMLQAWLPANWALLGGVIAVLRLGVFSYWTNAYHAAGSLTALGGALILGGLPRLMKTGRLRYALSMGAGAAILGLTRPYEGLLLCLPVLVLVGRWMLHGKNRPRGPALMRLAAAPLLVVAAAGAWLAYYDYRAFGKPTTLPYTIDRSTYAIAPYYVWQRQRPEPAYRHVELRNFYQTELDYYKKIHSPLGFLPYTLQKVGFTFLFYSGFALIIPLIMVRRALMDRRIRFLVVCVPILMAGMVIEIFLLPHYVAPFAAIFYAIGLQAMRHLRLWKPEGKPVGLMLVRMTVTLCVVLAGLGTFAEPLHITPKEWNLTWFGPMNFGLERARIETGLESLPGGQLAIVRYSPDHDPSDEEWVYNWADIDGSKVVWAREMDPADNKQLIQYYAGRKVWLVEPDAIPARISAYPVAEPAEVAAH